MTERKVSGGATQRSGANYQMMDENSLVNSVIAGKLDLLKVFVKVNVNWKTWVSNGEGLSNTTILKPLGDLEGRGVMPANAQKNQTSGSKTNQAISGTQSFRGSPEPQTRDKNEGSGFNASNAKLPLLHLAVSKKY